MREIIENVRANEALYDNLDVRMVERYEIIDRKPRVGEAGGNTTHEKATIDKDIHYISQDGMFRVDVDGRSTTAEHTMSEDRIRMFDGKTTRILDQKHIGNIVAGRQNDDNFIRPHMLLIRSSVSTVPLSTYLQGHAAMAAVPATDWNPDHTLEVTYQGEAEFQGLKCHKVWITASGAGGKAAKGARVAFGRWELWLAEDRNYLPVRSFAYNFYWSTMAIGEATVSALREIEPGVWFSVAVSSVHYDGKTIQREGRQKPSWRRTYDVNSVSLNPNYDISFFRDLTFPSGTSVYEVENGNIVRSYTIPQAEESIRRSYWWILWLNVAVVLAIVSAVYVRHRRKRRGAAA